MDRKSSGSSVTVARQLPPSVDALGEQAGDGGAQLLHAGAGMGGGRDQVGEGRRPFAHGGLDRLDTFGERSVADLVAFGEDDLVADSRLAEGVEDGIVGRFQAMACIDQHVDAGQRGATMQIIVNELVQEATLVLATAA